jgi:GTP-binding protein
MPLTVAIVGRPNTGKSTLFNRLAGKRLAIVDDTPGVTRDWSVVPSNFGGLDLRIVDTAGFEKGDSGSLQSRMVAQTREAIKRADVVIFLFDARAGVVPGDEIVADALRRSGKPVILAANKSESSAAFAGQAEGHALGFGEPISVSAEHGIGLAELREAIAQFVEGEGDDADAETETTAEAETESDSEAEAEVRPLRLAIIGRPNVGKSTLMNRLVGEERSLTGPEAGITRDAVLSEWQWQGRDIVLHDTAGMRKKAKIEEKLEKASVGSTLHAIRFADCVILAIDATQPLEKQDLTIADLVAREGRALVFVVNKWDLVKDRAAALKHLREGVDTMLPQVAGAALVGVSALTGEGIEQIMPAVMETDRVWNIRVPTGQLNRFLEEALQRHAPPAIHGRRVRIRYMTQAKARPPSFVLFGNQLNALPEHYQRYLINALRSAFGLKGTPIRFSLRTSKNPYADG